MYFVSILVSLVLINADPPTGWLQDTIGYETVEECVESIPAKATEMQYYIHNTFRGMGHILDVQCITEPDWIQRNVELGHKVPEEYQPKTNS